MAESELSRRLRSRSVNSALVIGHPGHELRIHGWLEQLRPRVFILTDGSGRSGSSRLSSSSRLLQSVGSERGGIYGRFSDALFYEMILSGDMTPFVQLAEELAVELIHHRVDRVLGDACEGYNPTHDVCRIIISAAVAHASRVLGRQIMSLAFDLAKDPRAENDSGAAQVATKVLTDEQLERKLSAAQAYPELKSEVNAALDRWGSGGFRVEVLREAGPMGCDDGLNVEEPIYEQFGRHRVATGQYARVIRRREHILPIAKALHRFATEQLR